jgi:PST family polysaccharide transporter
LIYFVTQNIEKILFPLFFGEAGNRALGLYSQAFGLMIKPVYLLTTPLTGVMVSSLAQAPLGSELYSQLTAKFFRLSALGLLPCAVGLTLVSEEVTLLLGGPAWRDAGPILRWLAPSIAAIGLVNLATLMLAARGQGRLLLIAFSWLLILTVQAAIVGIYAGRQSLPREEQSYAASIGLAAAFTLLQFIAWTGPFLWIAFRSVGVNPLAVLRVLLPAIGAAAVMGVIVWGTQYCLTMIGILTPAPRLLILVLTGVFTYAGLAMRELIWVRNEWLQRATSE